MLFTESALDSNAISNNLHARKIRKNQWCYDNTLFVSSTMTLLDHNRANFTVQALATSLPRRLLDDTNNSLLSNIAPVGRQAKRNAQQINYSEDFGDDFDFDASLPANLAKIASAGGNANALQQNIIRMTATKGTPRFEALALDHTEEVPVTNRVDMLIPIKIGLENPNLTHKLIDFFMWNINDNAVSPTDFAQVLCNDLDLPYSMQQAIADSINQQIEEYNFVSGLQLPPGRLCIVIVDISVSVNKQLYQDKFEWDLNQSEILPETFAEIVVADLGLAREFIPAISHALHETIIRVKKEIMEGSYNNEIHNIHLLRGLIFESGIRISTEASIQNGNDVWEPVIEILTPAEIERRENERIRNLRRLKRENMKRDYDDMGASKRRNVGRRKYDDM